MGLETDRHRELRSDVHGRAKELHTLAHRPGITSADHRQKEGIHLHGDVRVGAERGQVGRDFCPSLRHIAPRSGDFRDELQIAVVQLAAQLPAKHRVKRYRTFQAIEAMLLSSGYRRRERARVTP